MYRSYQSKCENIKTLAVFVVGFFLVLECRLPEIWHANLGLFLTESRVQCEEDGETFKLFAICLWVDLYSPFSFPFV